MHNVNNRSTDDHDLSDLAWSPSVGMGLQQGPFDWVPQQGRAELDPYACTEKHPEEYNVDCTCLCRCAVFVVACVSVICDTDYGSQGSDTRYSYHQISFLIFEIVLSLSEAKVERNNALCSLQKYCAERGLGPKM